MKTVLTLLAAAVLVISGCNAAKHPAKQPKFLVALAQGQGAAVETPAAEDVKPAVEDKKKDESWTVTAVGVTVEDARQVAQVKARDKVLAFLAQQKPPIRWQPPLEFLQAGHFIKDEALTVETAKDLDGKEVGSQQHWCTLRVEMSPGLFTDILEQEHQTIQADRQWMAGRIFAVALALVLALGGYFYLDEATKGFYTVLLRLGAITLVGAVGLAVWLVIR